MIHSRSGHSLNNFEFGYWSWNYYSERGTIIACGGQDKTKAQDNTNSITAKSCELYRPGDNWVMVPDLMTRGMIDHVAWSYVAPPVRIRDGFI